MSSPFRVTIKEEVKVEDFDDDAGLTNIHHHGMSIDKNEPITESSSQIQ